MAVEEIHSEPTESEASHFYQACAPRPLSRITLWSFIQDKEMRFSSLEINIIVEGNRNEVTDFQTHLQATL